MTFYVTTQVLQHTVNHHQGYFFSATAIKNMPPKDSKDP